MTQEEFRRLCLSFPDTVEGVNMSSTYFKTNGKDLARILDLDRVYFTGVPTEEVEMLVEAEPSVFWADRHYKNARCVVAFLGRLKPDVARAFVERRFFAGGEEVRAEGLAGAFVELAGAGVAFKIASVGSPVGGAGQFSELIGICGK